MSSNSSDTDTAVVLANAYEAVTDKIRAMIITRQFAPGERLRPKELAAALRVSTTPVREALRALESDGLVEFLPRRGSRVAKLSFETYEEYQAIRGALEILVCRYVAGNFAKIPIAQLRDTLIRIEETEAREDYPRRVVLVRQFFFTIFEASEKKHFLRILGGIWDVLSPYIYYFSLIPETVSARMDYFRKIYDACDAQDEERLVECVEGINTWATSTLGSFLRQHPDVMNFEGYQTIVDSNQAALIS